MEHVYPSSELIFLQSQSNFIEKTLGQGEKMKIRFECLVAHARTVKISRTPVHDFELNHQGQLQLFSSKNKFITLQGPGLVYIDMQAGDRFFKEVQMSLFLLLLYVALYVIMAFIVWFDKKDGKGRVSKTGDSSMHLGSESGGTDPNSLEGKNFIDYFLE